MCTCEIFGKTESAFAARARFVGAFVQARDGNEIIKWTGFVGNADDFLGDTGWVTRDHRMQNSASSQRKLSSSKKTFFFYVPVGHCMSTILSFFFSRCLIRKARLYLYNCDIYGNDVFPLIRYTKDYLYFAEFSNRNFSSCGFFLLHLNFISPYAKTKSRV